MAKVGAPDWFSLSTETSLSAFTAVPSSRRAAANRRPGADRAGARRPAAVLPMCDEPVRTSIQTAAGRRGLQEWLIVDQAAGPIEGIEVSGLEQAQPKSEVLDALSSAEAIVIGPSNP